MIREERIQRVLEIITKDGYATAATLARAFAVSEITIRRDLSELSERGFVQRVHGGAVIISQRSPDPPVIQRLLLEKECKEAIAREAAYLIREGESIFIGSGSTTAYLTQYLTVFKNLTVVTNALNISTALATALNIKVVVLGGMMRQEELSLIGHIAEQSLREVSLDKVIIGIPAIDLKAGLTNDYLPEVVTDRTILSKAREVILLADHTKVGRIASAFVAPLDRINTFITDSQADPKVLEQFRGLGVKVIVAGEDPILAHNRVHDPAAGGM